MEDRIDCLDHGYVRLVDSMGSDLSVVNAARVSYDRESNEFNDKDAKLVNFLAKHGHLSPFRHAALEWEVYAPLIIARQWWKYVVGHVQDPLLAWNESSRRYITEEPVFYIPDSDRWRRKPANSKQGSGDPLPIEMGSAFTDMLTRNFKKALEQYEMAMDSGVAPEQARLFLPAYAMYVRWRWTSSLAGVCHFINQRTASDAQYEIRVYADAVNKLTRARFPKTTEALCGESV